MSSDYLRILQLNRENSGKRLEQAYQMSRLRYERLTRSGPLQHYRTGLLQDAERAYEGLKKQEPLAGSPWAGGERPGGLNGDQELQGTKPGARRVRENPTKNFPTTHRRDSAHPEVFKSVIRDRAERSGYFRGFTKPAIWPELRDGQTYFGGAEPIACETPNSKGDGEADDRFCREVLYRLEGDLLRFSNREELLEMAGERGIGLFRANLLMAQIVESVRHYGLYQPGREERKLLAVFRKWNQNTALPVPGKQSRLCWWIVAGAVAAAAAMDAILVKWLG